jgi:hypothetical protein
MWKMVMKIFDLVQRPAAEYHRPNRGWREGRYHPASGPPAADTLDRELGLLLRFLL